MKTYNSPKDWAIDNGFDVKPGKGRMPKDASDAFKAAVKEGKVSLSSGPTARVESTAPSAPRSTVRVAGSGEVIEPAPMVHPESTRAFFRVDGKKVETSMRNACMNCRVSLHWCQCGLPQVVTSDGRGHAPVTLET